MFEGTKVELAKETTGAWIVHHGRKVLLDMNGASEFSAIDEASKAADLLRRMSASDEIRLNKREVEAYAKAAGLNPRFELEGILTVLAKKRIIDRADDEVQVIGVTTKGTLVHATDIFMDAEPSEEERAAILLAEKASEHPILKAEAEEFVGDMCRMDRLRTRDFIDRAQGIGFVDAEGQDSDCLLFNGNLFRRDSIEKAVKVLNSLSSEDQRKVSEFDEIFRRSGCVKASDAERILGSQLFEKLKAAGLYDINVVSNDAGENVYITNPGAFHKFTNPLIDDCFDMAKALVAALTYGMQERSSSAGRIQDISILLGKLVNGSTVGPATAIGEDYRVLEHSGVIRIIPDSRYPDRFHMRLLKKEVGEIALKVLTTGNASEAALSVLPAAPMSGYIGPEQSRSEIRKRQGAKSKRATQDILAALRGGRSL